LIWHEADTGLYGAQGETLFHPPFKVSVLRLPS
jgi:hypothetical protein